MKKIPIQIESYEEGTLVPELQEFSEDTYNLRASCR